MRSFAILILIMSLPGWPLHAQFSSKGTITFTRSVNMRLSMQLEAGDEFKNSTYYKEQIKKTPTSYPTYFKMSFNEKASHYFFDKAGDVSTGMFWDSKVASENTVIQDFEQHKLTAQKEIYEKNYIISDSLPKYKWKMHDELREIAGYQCRKATTVIHDSVVVVAYYTEQILVSSGPESFGGLPGMILGLAIPRLYTTWFATKVTDVELSGQELKKIKKGKVVDFKTLQKEIASGLKDWGSWGHTTLWRSTF